MGMCNLICQGNLVDDVVMRTASTGNAMATGRIAINPRVSKNSTEGTLFLNFVAYGNQATFLQNYGKKRTGLLLNGRLADDTYVNQQGQKVFGVRLIVSEVEFSGPKPADQPTQPQYQETAPASAQQYQQPAYQQPAYQQPAPAPASAPAAAAPNYAAPAGGFMNIPQGQADNGWFDEELPFN